MSILILALIVILLVALLVWAVDAAGLPSPINMIFKVIIILVGVVVIAQKAGLL